MNRRKYIEKVRAVQSTVLEKSQESPTQRQFNALAEAVERGDKAGAQAAFSRLSQYWRDAVGDPKDQIDPDDWPGSPPSRQ